LVLAAVLCGVFSAPVRAGLSSRIQKIVNRPSQRKVAFGISVVRVSSGRTVYSLNGGRALPPASNMKIVVTAAALRYLGSDWRYETRVGLAGDSLVVIGSGDPLLGDKTTDARYGRPPGWIFDDIAAALKRAGQTSVKGIILDTSVFDDQLAHLNWPVSQLNKWYACEVCGINYNDNCVDITVRNRGGAIDVSMEPRTGFLDIKNDVSAISRGDGAVGAYRTDKLNSVVLRGRCRKQQGPFSVAIERPAAFFGYLLAERLADNGIKVEGEIIERPLRDGEIVATLSAYRTGIADCLLRSNKDSLGLAAEALFKTIAAFKSTDGRGGSWPAGRRAVSEYLRSVGVESDQFFPDDGSGLSRANRLSADAITAVLLDVYNGPDRRLYQESLAKGGIDGTIAKYFKHEKYKGRIVGKTGYIKGVKSFSGYASADDGDYIFSVLTENANGKTRKAINDIAKAIIDEGSS
jgi:D-alanyl-D-alanine carboxypeptidase/D-alanyl-D-alanine-endopeptidase (penicillin-binding protein 4)